MVLRKVQDWVKNEENKIDEKELSEIDKKISKYTDEVSDLYSAIASLKWDVYEKKKIIEELKEEKASILEDIEEREQKELQEEIDSIECSLKCPYRSKPQLCKKSDRTRCPFRNGLNLINYQNYFEGFISFKNSLIR